MGDVNDNSLEARMWLKNNKNESALASNRFGDTKTALEFVEMLYESGAIKVEVDNIYDEPRRIEKEGGPYADSLYVTLPADKDKRIRLFEIFNQESEHEGFDPWVDDGNHEVMLWWD